MMLLVKIKQTTTQVPDHAYRKIIIGVSVSGKTNALLNPINYQSGIHKVYLDAKKSNEAKHQLIKNKKT